MSLRCSKCGNPRNVKKWFISNQRSDMCIRGGAHHWATTEASAPLVVPRLLGLGPQTSSTRSPSSPGPALAPRVQSTRRSVTPCFVEAEMNETCPKSPCTEEDGFLMVNTDVPASKSQNPFALGDLVSIISKFLDPNSGYKAILTSRAFYQSMLPHLSKWRELIVRRKMPLALIPKLQGRTLCWTDDYLRYLYAHPHLPPEVRTSTLRKAYGMSTHGASFASFVQHTDQLGPCFIIVKDKLKQVFGAFISPGIMWGRLGYQGTAHHCFVFRLYPRPVVFPPAFPRTTNVLLAYGGCFGLGGKTTDGGKRGGYFALGFPNATLEHGVSFESVAFRSTSLSSELGDPEFDVEEVEVWAAQPFSTGHLPARYESLSDEVRAASRAIAARQILG
eukprot:TRINITY_DN21930_c3_g1_i1.p1 TRINITY_DN21930_c3_g1~~TRINITY_DN21930_c3_g1_i1.p1  ORF type:complete len:390 (-),score=14.04 TRINITY_DN21930_c3_g1_i1:34-1203(-)